MIFCWSPKEKTKIFLEFIYFFNIPAYIYIYVYIDR